MNGQRHKGKGREEATPAFRKTNTYFGRNVLLAGRPAGRPGGARVVSGAEKKKSFDRGGPVWPPRSNVTNDRLRGGSAGALHPQPKTRGSGGRPQPKSKNIEKESWGLSSRCNELLSFMSYH